MGLWLTMPLLLTVSLLLIMGLRLRLWTGGKSCWWWCRWFCCCWKFCEKFLNFFWWLLLVVDDEVDESVFSKFCWFWLSLLLLLLLLVWTSVMKKFSFCCCNGRLLLLMLWWLWLWLFTWLWLFRGEVLVPIVVAFLSDVELWLWFCCWFILWPEIMTLGDEEECSWWWLPLWWLLWGLLGLEVNALYGLLLLFGETCGLERAAATAVAVGLDICYDCCYVFVAFVFVCELWPRWIRAQLCCC